ncbi:RING-H2 finger protein ATL57 isoform X2 [Lycium barbarum]|uniref:RING-H2 finger protein ATL57 isoform X2 n=1 Tax=Lycium barbarum TaxID=112863 RepID=UPI00293F68AE|nr:RING-H2 finger protein ATL57 isoform X2 [Lycium barbarum]
MRIKSPILVYQTRRLLQQSQSNQEINTHSTMSSSLSYPTATFQPMMNDSVTTEIERPFKLSAPFDSSMAVTILVLLTALFFLGFFSIYIRHFTGNTTTPSSSDADDRRRRHLSQPSSHRSCRKGMDPAAVQSLPLVTYSGAAEHLIEDCPICLAEFEVNEVVRLIPYCRHVFHQQCLDTWLASHVTCPLCRSTQFFKKVDEVRLDVVEVERSTVQECDTCRNIRRSCSSSSLGNRVALHRSASF